MKTSEFQKQPHASNSRSSQPFFGTKSQAFFSKEEASPSQTEPFFNPSSASAAPIQAKLTVGAVGDKYEQEADRVAAEVVNRIHSPSPEPAGEQQAVQRMGQEEELQTKPLQRMEEEDELQMSPLAESIQRMGEEEDELQMMPLQREAMEDEDELQMKPLLQREMEPDEEDELQMKPLVQRVGAEGDAVSGNFESELNAARGGGQSLAPDLQAQMGQAMGADFSGVRVHTDGRSDQLNRSIQAKAFTTGQDVFFRQGAYEPGSRGGQELIAHELTHVVQQGSGAEQGQKVQKENLEQTNIPLLQRKVLLPSQTAGEEENVIDTPEIRTSENFDKNHLVTADVTDPVARARLLARRGKRRNTIVNEQRLMTEVIDHEDAIENRTATGDFTTLDFSDGSSMQAVRKNSARDEISGVFLCPTVTIGARMQGSAIEIHHIEESTTDIGLSDEKQFPPLGKGY